MTRKALVLCSSKGLGFGSAMALAFEKCEITLTGRDSSHLESAKNKILAVFPESEIHLIPCDLSGSHDVENVVTKAIEVMSGLDILILNSPGPATGNFEDKTPNDWASAFDSLILMPIKAVRAAYPQLKKSKAGRIIAFTSISSQKPIANLALSNVLRPSVEGLVRDLSAEFAKDRITVNAIQPGRISSDRIQKLIQNIAVKKGIDTSVAEADMIADIPLRRLGTIEEFGSLVAFLASSSAGYITGQTITMDGGILNGAI